MAGVVQLAPPRAEQHWLDRYMEAAGVEQTLRPDVRRLTNPVLGILRAGRGAQRLTFGIPDWVPEAEREQLLEAVRDVVAANDQAHHDAMARVLQLVVEYAAQIAELKRAAGRR